jgi:hypothetical protein
MISNTSFVLGLEDMFRTVRELDSKHNIQNLRKNIQFGSNGSGIQSMEIESQNVKPQQLKTPLSNLNSKSMTGSSKQMSKLVWPTTSTKLNSKLLQSFNYSSMVCSSTFVVLFSR